MPPRAESQARVGWLKGIEPSTSGISQRESELAPDPGVSPEQEVAAEALGNLAAGPVGGAIAIMVDQLAARLRTTRGRSHIFRAAQDMAKLKGLEALRDILRAGGFQHSTPTTEKVYEAEAKGDDPVAAAKQAKSLSDAPAASKG